MRGMTVPEIRPGLTGERRVVVTEAMTTGHAGGARILTAPSGHAGRRVAPGHGRHLIFRVEAHNAREKIGEGRLRRTVVRVGSVA